jgi:hypothetical protein
MDHSTRTIAYSGGSREDRGRTAAPRVSPSRQNPREIQTRREMLDRRFVLNEKLILINAMLISHA